jgi:hypothetical protein
MGATHFTFSWTKNKTGKKWEEKNQICAHLSALCSINYRGRVKSQNKKNQSPPLCPQNMVTSQLKATTRRQNSSKENAGDGKKQCFGVREMAKNSVFEKTVSRCGDVRGFLCAGYNTNSQKSVPWYIQYNMTQSSQTSVQ